MLTNFRTKLFVASGIIGAIAGMAGVASADELTDAITSAQTQLLTYAAPLAAAVVAVALAFIAVKLIPRAIRMVANRFGGS